MIYFKTDVFGYAIYLNNYSENLVLFFSKILEFNVLETPGITNNIAINF